MADVAQSEWNALANEMRALDARVAQAHLLGADADPWVPPMFDAASRELEGYLDKAEARLREVVGAVKRARTSAEQRIQDAADEVAGIANSAASRARRMAHTLGFAVEKALANITDSLERGALAFGAGVALVILALLWWRSSGH